MQSIGRAMTLADQAKTGGTNHDHIRDAFDRHNILLGSNAMLAPSAALAGAAPSGATLSATTRKDLLQRMGNAPGAKLALSAVNMFGTPVVQAVQTRSVALGALDPRLKGVVALAREPVMVGASGARAAVMGAVPHASDTDSEVLTFVESLLAHRRIDLRSKPKKSALVAGTGTHWDHTTHVINSVGGKKVLQRTRFLCICRQCD